MLKEKCKYYILKGMAILLIIFVFPIGFLCYISDSHKERIRDKKNRKIIK